MASTPGFWGNLSLGLQTFGAVSSAFGSYYGAKTQASNLKHQATLAGINARIAELGAQSALEQGKQQNAALTLQAGRLKGRQRAALAANGVDLGVGNAAEAQASTDLMKEIDSNTIRANALRSAWGYRTQGVNYQNQAGMARAAAGGISPFGVGATNLLSGAANVATSWYRMSQAGTFGGGAQYESIDALAADKGWW